MRRIVIELTDVSRSYESPGGRVQALERTSLAVEAGNVAWVSGDSGSGKSTLLAIAGLLIVPDEGTVAIEGRVLSHESDARRTE
ncbi:MAG: ATP-binding cassette domain-containing protein, partial [Microbacterium sp.]